MLLTDIVTMDPADALDAAARYRELRAPTPEDELILAGLLALAAGKPVVNLRAALAGGDVDDEGLPRLAVMWANQPWCYLDREANGDTTFLPSRSPAWNARRFKFPHLLPEWSWEALRERARWGPLRSQVPAVPPEHRPSTARLREYAVLWEVEEWAPDPDAPRDPALLRPLAGDLWTVEAVWDLTDLERLVLGGRT